MARLHPLQCRDIENVDWKLLVWREVHYAVVTSITFATNVQHAVQYRTSRNARSASALKDTGEITSYPCLLLPSLPGCWKLDKQGVHLFSCVMDLGGSPLNEACRWLRRPGKVSNKT
jgi:hypothetical protein